MGDLMRPTESLTIKQTALGPGERGDIKGEEPMPRASMCKVEVDPNETVQKILLNASDAGDGGPSTAECY